MRCRRRGELGAAVVMAAVLGGCGSPPAVTPLLRVAERAVREEARRVEADGERDRLRLADARRSLDVAYDADLSTRDRLTPDWVRDATAVYVGAREALVRHEYALAAERDARRANLLLAADAARRATELLEQQDALITRAAGGIDLWRLLRQPLPEEAR